MNEIQARVTKWIFRNITTGYTFEDFFKNPQAQIECQLAYQKWCRYNLVCDNEMGPPTRVLPGKMTDLITRKVHTGTVALKPYAVMVLSA